MFRSCSLIFVLILLATVAEPKSAAAEGETLPADKEPLLRVDAGGPMAFVTALAFSPDGKTLYAGGWDKVVRVWTRNDEGVFEPSRVSYRVPVGPGLGGAINALALSPDGIWLAAAGNGMARNLADFRRLGFFVRSYGVRDSLMLGDIGTVYLFNTRDQSVRILRGHKGRVTALTFGPARGKANPLLLSLAVENKEGNALETQMTARLWDTDKQETLAVLSELPIPTLKGLLPNAILWQTGEDAGMVRAALALYDGALRIWQPLGDQERKLQVEDLRLNLTVAHLGGGRLLTAGYHRESKQWYLARWLVPDTGQPKRDRWGVLGEGHAHALSLLSRKKNHVPDLAAVHVLVPGEKGQPHAYRLRIADLTDVNFRVVKDILLWKDRDLRQVALATSLEGGYLAVAGNGEHSIHVYSLRSLLQDENPAPQILRGDALLFRHASFVRRGKEVGLLLNREVRKTIGGSTPEPDPEKGDLVFDFPKRRLTDSLAGWKAARPPAGNWQASLTRDERTIQVREGEEPIGAISIPNGEIVTDYALLPPGDVVDVPLLAVATHEDGQPRLMVYNARSGDVLRSFTGHSERLRSLAFAPDGRLLVSTAEDGTVCVWSLTDLKTVFRHGGLPGVDVGPADKKAKAVKVHTVDADSPVHGQLKPGDVLVGLVEKDQFRPIDSPRAFYELFYELRPGAKVSLRRGDPEGKDDIALVVGQGTDERKPLFTLFITDADKPAACAWIGWSPIGPYETSSAQAEKYLGWHFNTGDPKAPTRFADAGQYRKYYFREHLLEQLIQRGALGRLERPKLPDPVLVLMVEDATGLLPHTGQEPLIVRQPRIEVKVAVHEPPLSALSALTWRLDDGVETPLDLKQIGEASFQLPFTLVRGAHRFVVTAKTHEASPYPTQQSLTLHYQPLPPQIVYKSTDQQIFVDQTAFTLDAQIIPKVSGEGVRVTIRHRHDKGEEKERTLTLGGRDSAEGVALPLRHNFTLRPGNNEVEVIAVNGGAPDGAKVPETTRLKLPVFHYKVKPPVITFRQIVPLIGQKDERALAVHSSAPVVVSVPVVKLFGQIKTADEPLTAAVWDRGKGTAAAPLDGFASGKHVEFSFTERIELKPGPQIIRLRVRTKNSDEVEHHLTLDYQPPVPRVIRLTVPRDGERFEDDAESKTITVRGQVHIPPGVQPYQAVILVNGKPTPQPPIIDEKTGTLTGSAILGPRENRIWIEIHNAWGATSSSEVVSVWYVRPPVFLEEPEHEPVSGKARLNLRVKMRSFAPLVRESVRVEVNGRESAGDEVRMEEGAKNVWTVQVRGVPLDAGSREQNLALSLSNDEARCRVPAVFTLRSTKALLAPEVEFLEPRKDLSVTDPHVTIGFQVRSQGKLESVHLLHEGHPPRRIDLAGIRRVEDKDVLTVQTEVELVPGPNHLSVEAVSVSGRQPDSPRLVLNYVPPPLRIVMERLTELRPDGPAAPAQRQPQGVYFPEVQSGRVWLHGHISWADKGENWHNDYFLLRVFVNGFQQMPVEVVRQANQTKTPFRVRLLLNRRTGNRINLIAFRQDAGSPAEGVVNCVEPITAQRLHILALSPYSRSREVEERLLKGIHARAPEIQGHESAFQKVKVLPPLTGSSVSPHHLCYQLARFKESIRLYQKAEGRDGPLMNEVLLLYYEGGEKIDKKGHYFETYSPSGVNAFGMPCDKLVSYLVDVPGAHVLLLDVDQSALAREEPPRDRIDRWKDDYPDARTHVVVMRFARRSEPGRQSAVRLIPVLEKQIPQASRLSKLIPLIEEALRASTDRELLVFTKYLPAELADLLIGPPPP